MFDKLLMIPEAAERLNRTRGQLEWMIKAGTAPRHAKIGGRIVFKESDIEAFIDEAFAAADAERAS